MKLPLVIRISLLGLWLIVSLAASPAPSTSVARQALPDQAGPLPPTTDYTYREDFTSYTAKSYTQDADWNIVDHRLDLLHFAGGIYTEPAVAQDALGGAYVVWKDLRNNQGDGNWDIYAQRVDARGNRLWPHDLRVNLGEVPAYQSTPQIVTDSQGNAIVVWAEHTNPYFGVHAQKLSPTGARLWANEVRVNGEPAYRMDWGHEGSLAIAMDGQDNVIVVWEGEWEYTWTDPDVYAQKIGRDGQRLWATDVKVNSDSGHRQRIMAVDVDASGLSVVAWVDERNVGEDIYAQRLDANGQRLWAQEVKVSAGSGVLHQGDPNVALDEQGFAVIVWRQGSPEPPADHELSTINAQRLSPAGVLQWQGNVRVNQNTQAVFRGWPCAAALPGGDTLVIWSDNRNGYSVGDIVAQRLTRAGTTAWAGDFAVSPTVWWGQNLPAVQVVGQRAVVTWMHWGNVNLQVLDSAAPMLLLPWPARINEPDGHAKQLAGDVATLANGEALVVWDDSRRSNGDVWARVVNADGQMAWPTAFQVNDLDDEDDWRPQTAVNANSQALVIWNHDNKNGVDGQLLDASGVPLWAGDQRLNVDSRKASFGAVLPLPDNSFLVAWPGQRQPDDNHWDLFLQRISAEGERLWSADRRLNVGDYLIYDIQVDARNRPALALDAQGHVIVTWRGDTGSGTDIYVRRFTVNGVPLWGREVALGAHLNVRLPADRFNHTVGAANEILVAWAASNDGASGIRLQRLNLNGQLLGASIWATSATGEIPYSSPDLARLPDGDWILAWDDEHSMGSNVYAQRLSPTGGVRWSQPLMLNQAGVWPVWPALTRLGDGSLLVAWNDGRTGDENMYAQRFSADGALLWSQDLTFQPPGSENFYYTLGVAESNTVDVTADMIMQASFTVAQALNGGRLDYYLSNDGGQTWEGVIPGELHRFTSRGSDLRWRVYLYPTADGRAGPTLSQLTLRYGAGVVGDAFEPDSTCAQAQAITTDGSDQLHNFHQSADDDWVRFDAIAGTLYVIEGTPPDGSPANLLAELYDTCNGLPRVSQGYAYANGIRLEYRAPVSGRMNIHLTNNNPEEFGEYVSYRLSVRTLSDVPTPGALVIVAGRLYTSDVLPPKIHNVSGRIYQVFQEHDYTDDRIYYLATDLGLTGVDGLANVANLQAAITSWAPSRVGPDRAFTLYMVDHGSHDLFYLDAPRHQWVSPAQLNQWLTYLQTQAPGVRINVIIEACQSGSFIEPLQTLSAPGRAVITSTSGRGLAWASDVGALFSDHFLDMVTLNASLGAGFRSARDAAQQAHPSQVAWLDDNGNGIPNEASDGQESALRGFAYAGTLDSDWPPLVAQASGSASWPSGQGTIRARVLDDTQGVSLVWAVIYPPSYQPPTAGSTWVAEVLPTAVLAAQGNDEYATAYLGFLEAGAYRIVIHAEDRDGLRAQPVTVIIQTSGAHAFLPMITR